MECGRGIGEPKEHDSGFKKAFMGNEGSFPLMAIFDMNIVVAPMDIKFGE